MNLNGFFQGSVLAWTVYSEQRQFSWCEYKCSPFDVTDLVVCTCQLITFMSFDKHNSVAYSKSLLVKGTREGAIATFGRLLKTPLAFLWCSGVTVHWCCWLYGTKCLEPAISDPVKAQLDFHPAGSAVFCG